MDSIVTPYIIFPLLGFITNADSSKPLHQWKEWKPGKDDIPKCAILGGKGRYVARVNTFNGHISAMIGRKRNVAVAILQKKEVFSRGIEVLCTKQKEKFYWQSVDWQKLADGVLNNALVAGFQKDISSYLYVGRAKQPNLYKVGKVIAPKKKGAGLWIWQDDKPIHLTKFELLKTNQTK